MLNKNSFVSEVLVRKIPQIMGMYIASVWLAVEMADWMSNKFNIMSELSSYVFIGMLTFLPAVMVLAWGHGKPGKDHWSNFEKFWIPFNTIVSIMAIILLIKTPVQINSKNINNITPVALKTSSDISTRNNSALQEVSVQANYNRVLLFFWENKTNDKTNDWLSYAGSWLVSQDLKRTPDISSVTPYSSKQMVQRIQNKGFLEAKNLPFPLALQIAQKSSKKWMLTGSFSKNNGVLNFKTNLFDVETGKLVLSHTEQDENMFVALDKISTKLSQFLIASDTNQDNIIPDLAIQDHVSNNIDAIKSIINAYNYASLHKDFKAAIKEIDNALVYDKNFALAHILAVRYYQKLGDYPNAIKHIDAALAMDYKIYQEQIFELKAGKFYMQGNRDKAGLVQEKWVNLFPNSPRAHGALAGYYLYSNNKLDSAQKELEILLEIDKDNPKILVNLGRIYRIQENKAKATEVLGRYLQENPDESDAYMQMGYALSQFGLYKKAIKLYEQASILGTEDFDAEIAKAIDTMQLGNFEDGLNQLDGLLADSATDQERYWTLNAMLETRIILGQTRRALEILKLMEEPGKNVMDPFNYLLNFEDYKISIFNAQGKYKQAIKYSQTLRKHSKPPFDSIVGILFLITYGNMDDEKNYRIEFLKFEKFLNTYNNPYWKSFIPALKSRILVWDEKYGDAIELLDNSVKVIKQSISGLSSLDKINEIDYFKAIILIELKKYGNALDTLTAITQRDPNFAKAYALSAKVNQILNQPQRFDDSYTKAMKIWQNADNDFVELIKLKKLKTKIKLTQK